MMISELKALALPAIFPLAVCFGSHPIQPDTLFSAELISTDLYRLRSDLAIVTRGCEAGSADVRIGQGRQKLIFITDSEDECEIETWVAPSK